MDYNAARALVGRWLAGETTLAEEGELRGFFGGAPAGLPRDLEACRPLFGPGAGSVAEMPRRKLVLHTEPATTAKSVTTATATTRRAEETKSENGRRAEMVTANVRREETKSENARREEMATDSVHKAERRTARPSPAAFTLRRMAAAAAVVAVVAAVGVVATRNAPSHPAADEIVCVVDGVRITDPADIERHTRRTLEMIDDNLRKPERTLARQLDGVGELLDRFSNDTRR